MDVYATHDNFNVNLFNTTTTHLFIQINESGDTGSQAQQEQHKIEMTQAQLFQIEPSLFFNRSSRRSNEVTSQKVRFWS